MTAGQRRNLFIILILGALSTVSPFSIDMYLAALPRIADELHTTTARVSLSLSSYFIGLAAGQLFYGPVLDRYGRKRPLYAGMALYVAASLACAFTHDVNILIGFRLLQALGGCVAQVGAMAMVRDFFHVSESAKIFSLLMLVLGVSPLLAPSVGSLVAVTLGWQWVFILLAAIGTAITMVTMLWLPEGHKRDTTISFRPSRILGTYWAILTDPQFYTYCFSGAFAFSGLFVYLAGSSIIFMGVYHVGAGAYSAIFALLAAGFIGSSQINILLSRHYKNTTILRAALTGQVTIAAIFIAGILSGWFGLTAIVVMFLAYLSCAGIASPNGSAMALAPFAKNAGSASALLGFFQMGIGALASAGVGLLNVQGVLPIAALLLGTSGMALAILVIGRRRIRQPIETDRQEDMLAMH